MRSWDRIFLVQCCAYCDGAKTQSGIESFWYSAMHGVMGLSHKVGQSFWYSAMHGVMELWNKATESVWYSAMHSA